MDIITKISQITGLPFTDEKTAAGYSFAPIDVLDYIYAVLYSNKHREKYKEFLKIDFPRIPYPSGAEYFQKCAAIGSILRNLHLMQNVSPTEEAANFPVAGNNEIETLKYQDRNVYINKQQYFGNIPLEAWNYYIGGYQPAQKWLKDRKGRSLSLRI